MSEPFLAEIRLVGFNYPPRGWALCDGQIMPINQNQSLFSLLGTTYGGDGRTSYALPDLRGRCGLHEGNNYPLGQKGGTETHTLTSAEIPSHTHSLQASSDEVSEDKAAGNVLASAEIYTTADAATLVTLKTSITSTGGSQAHENRQPYLAVNFCIALQGLFPSRN